MLLRLRRLARAASLSALLGMNTGCYTTRPLMGAPDPGTQAVAILNDRGRVALGETLGANVDRVTGQVVSRSDTSFVLAVRSVRFFGGQSNEWTGERVTVPVQALRAVEARRFSRARTFLVVGTLTAALVVLMVTRSILGDDGAAIEMPLPGGPPAGS
jgi:hypothetical protein